MEVLDPGGLLVVGATAHGLTLGAESKGLLVALVRLVCGFGLVELPTEHRALFQQAGVGGFPITTIAEWGADMVASTLGTRAGG